MTFSEAADLIVRQLDSIGFDYGDVRISLYRALLVLAVIAVVIVSARLASSGVRRLFRRLTSLDSTQQLLGEKIVGIVVWVICVLLGVDVLGVDLTAFTVFTGAFGLALGFGLQKTFGNLLAGIILLMDRSIKPGDVIAVGGGVVGEVKKIGLRAVSVTTRDKIEYLIPNENLMINQVENWSYSSRDVRLKIPVGIDYATDIELAERLMLQAARGTPRVLEQPGPTVWVTAFGDSSIQLELQVWINDPEMGLGDVRSGILKRLWALFRENGIRIPFPQREVTVKKRAEPPTDMKAPPA